MKIRFFFVLALEALLVATSHAQTTASSNLTEGYVFTGTGEGGKMYVNKEAKQIGTGKTFEYQAMAVLREPVPLVEGAAPVAVLHQKGIVDCAGKRAHLTEMLFLSSDGKVLSQVKAPSVEWMPVTSKGSAPHGAFVTLCVKA